MSSHVPSLLTFQVTLAADRDDPRVTVATVDGVPGRITATGSRREVLAAVRQALEALLDTLTPVEIECLAVHGSSEATRDRGSVSLTISANRAEHALTR